MKHVRNIKMLLCYFILVNIRKILINVCISLLVFCINFRSSRMIFFFFLKDNSGFIELYTLHFVVTALSYNRMIKINARLL